MRAEPFPGLKRFARRIAPRRAGVRAVRRLGLRFLALGYLAVLLLVPVGMVFYRTFEHGVGAVWDAITTPAAISAFWLTIEVTATWG